jgi:hypothetical protein
MATTRLTKETLYIRHDFTDAERLEMGSALAQAHNRMADIEDEEQVMKSQIKERKSGVELTINSLSRNLANGFTMENIVCDIKYDQPNVGEVTYLDPEGRVVKTRPMTLAERQMDLPLDEQPIPADKSAENIDEFFKPGRPTEQPTTETAAPVPLPSAEDLDAVVEAPAGIVAVIGPEPFEATNDDLPAVLAYPQDAKAAEERELREFDEQLQQQGQKENRPAKSGPRELKAYHEEQLAKEEKPKRTPKGFSKPLPDAAW